MYFFCRLFEHKKTPFFRGLGKPFSTSIEMDISWLKMRGEGGVGKYPVGKNDSWKNILDVGSGIFVIDQDYKVSQHSVQYTQQRYA